MAYIGKQPSVNRLKLQPQSADPSNPEEGDVFYSDGTSRTKGAYQYIASNWVSMEPSTASDTAQTSNYTALITDEYIRCDASSAAFTVTLYAAASNAGRRLTIIKTDSSSNQVTIDPNASETINGAATFKLNSQNESVTLECNGTNWQIAGRYIDSSTKSTSVNWSGTGGTATCFYQRVGDVARFNIHVAITGSVGGSPSRVNIPGFIPDTAKFPGSGTLHEVKGKARFRDASGDQKEGSVTYDATVSGNIEFRIEVDDSGDGSMRSITPTVPFTWASGDEISLFAEIPIEDWEG